MSRSNLKFQPSRNVNKHTKPNLQTRNVHDGRNSIGTIRRFKNPRARTLNQTLDTPTTEINRNRTYSQLLMNKKKTITRNTKKKTMSLTNN